MPDDWTTLCRNRPHRQAPAPAVVGDLWHRVSGDWIEDGSESYQGMELAWTTWRCVKTTPCGAWFESTANRYGTRAKPRFALTDGAKNLSRTKQEALERLIARKKRQLQILNSQKMVAEDTLAVATTMLSAMKSAA